MSQLLKILTKSVVTFTNKKSFRYNITNVPKKLSSIFHFSIFLSIFFIFSWCKNNTKRGNDQRLWEVFCKFSCKNGIYKQIQIKVGLRPSRYLMFLWLSTRKGRFETSPYDRPQNILFLYESSLAERSRSCADSYHIHPSKLQVYFRKFFRNHQIGQLFRLIIVRQRDNQTIFITKHPSSQIIKM